jgi:hypothetical protein
MSLKHIDMESAMRRLADKRIEEAMREGKFDNLPGAGKPLDLEPMPADESARLMWWALRILKQNDVMPEEVRWRKAIDMLKENIHHARDERRVVQLVGEVNQLVHKLNTLGTNALHCGIAPLDLEHERRQFHQRNAQRVAQGE